jgi:hypothetical protein
MKKLTTLALAMLIYSMSYAEILYYDATLLDGYSFNTELQKAYFNQGNAPVDDVYGEVYVKSNGGNNYSVIVIVPGTDGMYLTGDLDNHWIKDPTGTSPIAGGEVNNGTFEFIYNQDGLIIGWRIEGFDINSTYALEEHTLHITVTPDETYGNNLNAIPIDNGIIFLVIAGVVAGAFFSFKSRLF